MSAILDAALAYAGHGWRVLPLCPPTHRCASPGKIPHLPDWPRAASTDPDVIRGWWAAQPSLNVGILTGPPSGLAVIDVDPRSGGAASLAQLEERIGMLPGTVTGLTGGGGLHLLYRHPGRRVTSSAHQLGPGLDVKADDGQIVAPPSVHAGTGRPYSWLGDVWRESLPAWPDALLPAARAAPERPAPPAFGRVGGHPVRRLEALVQFVMDSAEGERNGRLYWAACRGAELIAGGLPEAMVADALQLAGEAIGLALREVALTVRSGLRQLRAAA